MFMQLEVDRLDLAVEAAVLETLPSSVFLGTDVAELATLLGTEACVQPAEDHHYEVMVVTTRTESTQKKDHVRERSSIHGETNSSCVRRST